MKAILVALTVLSLGLPASAATDEEKFRKLLNQTTVATGAVPSVSDVVQKARVACVCMGEQANSLAGVVVRRAFGSDQISFLTSCVVPSFGTDGSANAFVECFNWELLTKSP
jgi:hypothetical protein